MSPFQERAPLSFSGLAGAQDLKIPLSSLCSGLFLALKGKSMTSQSFMEKLRECGEFDVFVDNDEKRFLIRNSRFDVFEFSWDEVGVSEWSDLIEVFRGSRKPLVMEHYSKIVGYVANHRNWNKSKLAELADRHKGNYGVPESYIGDYREDTIH